MLEEMSATSRRKRPNFFYWYYNKSLHEILEIWKNFLVFVLRYFSILELFKTLLSPWRRDVAVQSWRGLHPLKTLEMLFENIFSRLIGAIVRSFVIILGLMFFVLVFVFGLATIFFWIGAPLIFIYSFVYQNFAYSVSAFFSWIIVSVVCYFSDTKILPINLDHEELLKHPVFERICARFGISRKRFSEEIISNESQLNEFLKISNLTQKDYSRILKWELEYAQQKNDNAKFWQKANLEKIKPIGIEWRFGYTVNLDRYCSDLSKHDFSEYSHAKLIGRNDEYELLKLILARPDENCVLIVGNSGIGKKTLIHSFARNVRERNERTFGSIRILLFDLGRAISDAINSGEDVENNLRRMFYEACYAGNVILVIENLEHFLGKEQSSFHPDISAVLSEFLHIPNFQIIATSSTNEYHQLVEKQEQVAKYFEVIEMREPSQDETITVLLNQLEKYEKKRVLFTYKALQNLVRDSEKYKWGSPLPERALDLAMEVLMFWEKKSNEEFIGEKTVNDYLTLKTGVSHGEIGEDEQKKLLGLEEKLHRQVIGQEEAIKQVSEALRRARSGIGNIRKPVGSFLFLGPTGVGKTETAKALAKEYFGDESKMIRFDMSEFQTPNSIDRLLGSSNLNKPGRLVTQVKDNPYSLILLDEIEKAYPDILDIFLQILDEGYVSDAFGEKINFRNALIIATSNAGAALIKKMIEESHSADEIKQAVIDYAIENNIFRTEFLNRFDGVIFFRPLNENELVSVVRLQLQKFARHLQKKKNIEIEFDDTVVDHIIKKGYNPIFGARSLNRFIEEEVESIVAKKIISGELKAGEKMQLSL